ncbi:MULTISPECIES: class I SAM-dependent methyltransferase [Paenibacillus]|uniref:class I SAM-dependent DNA methyltransferase n=1 Tax=Paenibacillus TaxID=44249 RepID=UPI000B86566A|nr:MULTISPECIES: class I SAM-dependent methyltransferase [Paenibacillus]PRA05828.1 class I SAM-dependent methyltransferase [Paenibacillus sp. MYb63]PRA50536.1 class I SAM-dependent methyltransferase [Paenibacillus sp. MYb67]QZN75529.1 class I SAM-dependent methyltransferase [Paenibacillus sp. DR312]
MSYRKFAYVYDELMEDMPYPDWIRFARTAWEKHGMPKSVAELGCGTGSITIPLVNSGFEVTGIDLSADMLSVARSKMEATPQGHRLYREGSVRWVQQDMREWRVPEPVDSVISFCDCVNYLLEQEDVIRTFQRTYEMLKPDGTFLFDVHHPNTLIRYDEEQPFVLDERSVSYIWTCDLDQDRCEIEHHLSIFSRVDDGSKDMYQRFEEVHVQRAYNPDWMKLELSKAGFRDVKVYADFEWKEAKDSAQRLFYVAVK